MKPLQFLYLHFAASQYAKFLTPLFNHLQIETYIHTHVDKSYRHLDFLLFGIRKKGYQKEKFVYVHNLIA